MLLVMPESSERPNVVRSGRTSTHAVPDMRQPLMRQVCSPLDSGHNSPGLAILEPPYDLECERDNG